MFKREISGNADKISKKTIIALKMKKEYNNKGFTLLEIIVALAVTVIFSGIVLMSLPSAGIRSLDEACKTLQADLRLAQRLSVIEGQRYKVEFDSASNMYKILLHAGNSYAFLIKERKFTGGIELMNVTGNTEKVEYTPTGTTGNACTITLRNSAYIVNLTINVGSGRIAVKEFIKR